MNAPLRLPLSAAEVDAHLTILETIEDAQDGDLPYRAALMRFQVPLETFAPRCVCSRRLKFGPWVNSNRIVACSCGVSFFECRL